MTFVNDSKATNADAAARALVCYDRLVWIAGGMAKAGGIEPLVPLLPAHRQALLIGRDAPRLRRDAGRATACRFDIVGTLEAAVPAAYAAARARRAHRRAAVAGLRELRPVHRLRPARRPVRRHWRRAPRRREAGHDADASVARRQLAAGPLVVDRRPLDAGRDRRADRLRLHHDAGRQPGGRRAHRHVRATSSSSSRWCSWHSPALIVVGGVAAVAARRPAAGDRRLPDRAGADRR